MQYYSDNFREFVSILTKNTNTLNVSNKAISLIADEITVSRITVEFYLIDTLITKQYKTVRYILFDKDNKDDGAITDIEAYKNAAPDKYEINKSGEEYKIDFTTEKNGKATFFIYHDSNMPKWTEDDIKFINIIKDILIICYARSYLTRLIDNSKLFDAMSGIPNAAGYLEFAKTTLSKGQLNNYNAYYFNLKRFRMVNRKYGKNETDRMIIDCSRKLAAFAEDDECIGRLGGDNFVALIKRERTKEFLDHIQNIELIGRINGVESSVIIKSVTGCYEIKENSPEELAFLIDKCAVAMNIAKNLSNKPYLFYTAELHEMVNKKQKALSYFPAALENKEFIVYYQPKVDTFSLELKGAEGLARWKIGDTVIPPGVFIPVLEEDGSICQLDFYMLERVCEDIQRWISEGLKPVKVSVNFSRMNLINPSFADDILSIISKYDVPKDLIMVEITETMDEAEKGLLQKFMNRLDSEGISTAIDDFGTGYSSINILRDFPVDVLKLDKSFIDNHIDRPKDHIVLDNIVKMATELDIEVVMEGVETKEQYNFMKEIKCQTIQGYLFNRPLPEEEFKKKLVDRVYKL